jgi:hypothetical protein
METDGKSWVWLLAPSLIALVASILGAFGGASWAHSFTSRRDLANEKRKLTVAYLLEAYRKLETLTGRTEDEYYSNISKLESALADIQLLGTPKQVELAQKFASEFVENRSASLDGLIQDLRGSLRKEMELQEVSPKVLYLRVN